MTFQDILQWWNLIYVGPLVVSLAFIAATVFIGAQGDSGHDVGDGVSHDIGDAGHDFGHDVGDAGHDFGHDVGDGGDMQADAQGHDVEDQSDGDGSGDHDSTLGRVLWVLGIGRVPITLLLGTFMLFWGVFGMFSNQVFAGIMKYPGIYIWPSLAVTFAASSVVTRSIAALVGRYMPGTETYVVSRLELVGSLGKTVYTVSDTSGTVDISDVYGTVHRVQAKVESGSGALPSGTEVMVIDFDDMDKRFVVRKSLL